MVESTDCYCKGTGFNFQHLHGGLLSSVIPVTGDLMLLSGLDKH